MPLFLPIPPSLSLYLSLSLSLSIYLSIYLSPSLPQCNFVIKQPSVNEGKPRRCFAEFSAHRELIPRLGFQSARNERIPRGKRSRKSGHYLRGDVALLLAAEQRNNESRRTNILRGAASPPSLSLSLSLFLDSRAFRDDASLSC